jgi:hypothetical protein
MIRIKKGDRKVHNLKKECASCRFYKPFCFISNGVKKFYGYGTCLKGQKEQVKSEELCHRYEFNGNVEEYRPSFQFEKELIFQLIPLEEEILDEYLQLIYNPASFRISEKGEIFYKYDLEKLVDLLKKNHFTKYVQRAEWFIRQQLQQYQKTVHQLSKETKEFHLLR